MPQLSEWLQLMLAEIARKQDDARRGAEEAAQRRAPSPAAARSASKAAPAST